MKKLIKIISLMFVMSGVLATPPDWQNPVGMQYSMTITAIVKVDGIELSSTDDMVAAFVGSEVRGVGNLIYHSGLNRYFIFLTVFSNNISGETLSFKAYHSGNDVVADMLNELTFVNDEQLGQISAPYVIANNSPPINLSLSNQTITENESEGTEVGIISAEDPDNPPALIYYLASGTGDTDNAFFTVDGNTLNSGEVFDFETKESYEIRLGVHDGTGGVLEKEFIITISDINEAPTDLSLDNTSLDENQDSGTLIGELSTVDQDTDDEHTYSFVTGEGDDDNSFFTIIGSQIFTDFIGDFENKNEYIIRVASEDSGSETVEKNFTITIADINDDPIAINLDNTDINENQNVGILVGGLSTEDQDEGDSHTYSFVPGEGDDDNSSFIINGSQILTNFEGDYETKNEYTVRIASEDNSGKGIEETFVILISDINDSPDNIILDNIDIEENQDSGVLVGGLSTSDQDEGDLHTYSFVSGNGSDDNNYFLIVDNQLFTDFVGDHETKSEYSIRLASEDSGNETLEVNFTITISNVNDSPISISLDDKDIIENLEKGSLVGELSTSDQDEGDIHTYTLVSGDGDDDNDSFIINDDQLLADFVGDYETKSQYFIRIVSEDSGNATIEKSFTITISDVNDAPTQISLDNSSFEEGLPIGTLIGNLSTEDQDSGDSHTYSFVSGEGDDDNASFTISQGELFSGIVGDFDVQNEFSVRVKSTDLSEASVEVVFTILLTNADNNSPTDIGLDNSSISENEPSGTLIGNLSTEDLDEDDAHTYSFVVGEGDNDNVSFTISGAQILTAFSGDYETKNEYSIRVSSEDSGNATVEKVFTITIVDINEAPTDLSIDNTSISENQDSGVLVGAFITSDQDEGDTHSYSLVSGDGDDDNESFTLNDNQILTAFVGDFETKSEYTIRIKSEDSEGGNVEKAFTISITDENDEPTSITLDNNSFEEGLSVGTLIGNFSTIDQDSGDSHVYSLVSGEGDADNNSFTINENELLSNIVGDFDTQNEFSIRVKSEDQSGASVVIVFNILLTDGENNPPTAIILDNNTVLENQETNIVVGNLATTDADEGDSHAYNLVSGEGDNDNESFSVSTNQLIFNITGDYETKSSYSVRLSSKDSGNEIIEEVFTINLIDVNEAPIFTKGADQILLEDVGSQTIAGWASNIENVDEGQVLNFTVTNDNNALFSVQPSIDVSNGTLSYTPVSDAFGSASIAVVLSDDGGTDNGGIDSSELQTFTITVNSVNDAPSFVKGDDQVLLEDAGSQTIVGWANNIIAGPSNENDQNLTFIVNTDNNDLFSALPAVDELTGNLTFTSADNAFGKANVTIELSDDGGVDNGGVNGSEAQTFTIMVEPVNDAPEIDEILLDSFCPGATTQIDLTNFTSDIDNEVVSEVLFAVDDTEAFNGFEVTIDGSLLNLIHNAQQVGSFNITVSANDQNGGFSFRTINISTFYLDANISNVGNILTVTEGESYKWFLDGNLLEGEVAQAITAHDVGSYTVEVTYSGGCVVISEAFFVDNLTVIDKPRHINKIKVYPNPVKDFIQIDIEKSITQDYIIRIVDFSGKQVLSERFSGKAINISKLKRGIYILQLSDNNSILERKKIIKD